MHHMSEHKAFGRQAVGYAQKMIVFSDTVHGTATATPAFAAWRMAALVVIRETLRARAKLHRDRVCFAGTQLACRSEQLAFQDLGRKCLTRWAFLASLARIAFAPVALMFFT